MIDELVRLALRKRLTVVLICACACLFGAYAWSQLAFEAYPDVADTSVRVSTTAPGYAAEEVEQKITIPLERELNGTPGLLFMRSKSTFGLSLITLVFREGIDDYWARQRITERIQSAVLPPNIAPGLDPVSSPTGQIYYYTLESETKGLRELSELQRWVIIPALKQVPGVADVQNFGGITTQFQLELDPQQLVRFNLSLANVEAAINANSASSGGSVVTRGELGYVVRGIGLLQTLEDMGAIVVAQRNGTPILLRDLGKVKLGNQERHGVLGENEKSDAVEGTVLLLKGQNPSVVLAGVHAKVQELNARLKANGAQIVPYLDRADLIDATVSKVSHTILRGVALVFIVVVLFLGNIRAALIICMTIPMALLGAFIVMHLTGISANLLSLGAIDFGIIVDGAIVVTDAVMRRREAAPDAPLSEDEVAVAVRRVARPVFFATLIIVTAYLPLFAFQRIEAKLFHPMIYAIGFAQLAALLLALTLVPGLAYAAYHRPLRIARNRGLEWVEARYRRLLSASLDRPNIAYAVSGAAAVLLIALGMTVSREFLPELDEGSIWLHAEMPGGISLTKAKEMSADLRKAVLEFPEVATIVTHVGRNDDGTDPWTPSHVEAAVMLRPYYTWPVGGSKRDLIQRMEARLAEMPGYEIAFSQPIIDSVTDKIFEPHSQLVLRIFGDDFNALRRIAKDAAETIRKIPGAADVRIDQQPPLAQIAITADRQAAARYGINVADIADLIQTGIGGGAVSQVFIGERRHSTSVRFPAAVRSSPEAIGSLLLTSSSGALVPLSQVAQIRLQSGESTINRHMNHRYLLVKFNSENRSLPSLLDEAQKTIAANVNFDPQLYRLEWGGHFESEARAEGRFALVISLMLGLMIVLLYAEFGRLRHVALTLAALPLATFGGLLALHLVGGTLNVASAVGFIALFGVAVMNGVIMVANLERMVRDAGLSLREAVVAGAAERLRPILLTAMVATVGMLPAALASGVGSDVQRSIAIVVTGGLLPTTLLTLVLLPILYFAIERRLALRERGRVLDAPSSA